ncbi:MAG: hypothetical protein MZW92_03555 [Comamonadaceae bacterium]|nr:hypothetical protein [Comamonadaceae bacterium]
MSTSFLPFARLGPCPPGDLQAEIRCGQPELGNLLLDRFDDLPGFFFHGNGGLLLQFGDLLLQLPVGRHVFSQ